MKQIMRKLGGLLIAMVAMVLMTSCSDDEKASVTSVFVCSRNLFDFVEMEAVYTTNKGEEIVTPLNEDEMFRFDTESRALYNKPNYLLGWIDQHKYDDVDLNAKVTIQFKKKEGVDYSLYSGQKITFFRMLLLDKLTTDGGSHINVNEDLLMTFGFRDDIEGDELETYIDAMVKVPMVREK